MAFLLLHVSEASGQYQTSTPSALFMFCSRRVSRMARLHAYSSDAKESPLLWVKIGGYLAAMSLFANSLLHTLLADQLGGHEKIVSPLSVGILGPLLYWIYNNLLWKIFAGL